MGVKYRVAYRDYFNQECRVDIYPKIEYTGDVIMLRGIEGQACTLERDCSDDPNEPIINTKALINVYQTEGLPIDIQELQQAQDRDFIVESYINNSLEFKGFLIPDGIRRIFQAAPFELNMVATDGLMLLDNLRYTHNNLTGGRCILNYFRQILFSDNNLGLPLPIQWVNALKNANFPLEDDVFTGSLRWASRGEGFTDYNGNVKTCLYILENMLRSMQCRIVQDKGLWKIKRINDIVTGSYVYRETPGVLTGLDVTTSGVVSAIKTIAGKNYPSDYSFINEDAEITVAPPLNRVTTTYDQDQRDNILPNGNMDIVSFSQPIYWNLTGGTSGSVASFQSVGSLSKAAGQAVEVTNPVGGGACRFELADLFLPIDSDVLYTYINVGFKFSIINGATIDPDGYIVWDSTPFTFKLVYFAGTTAYYLNENGFWVTTETNIQITVPKLKLNDVAQIDFNGKQDIILPLPQIIPIEKGTNPCLYLSFNIPEGRKVVFDDIYINTDNNSDVYEASYGGATTNTAKEDYSLRISSSHNGFYVSNFMTNFSQSGQEKFFIDGDFTDTLTAINSHSVIRNRYKSSFIFNGSIYGQSYEYGEIYNIQTLDNKNFLPLRTSWNTETNTINMRCIEVRNDSVNIYMKHYGKNDQTVLSN